MTVPPRVTVVVPALRAGKRIRLTAESVLASDHPDFGVCLVDGTDDGEVLAVLGDARREPRLRCERAAGLGRAAALNVGASSSCSESLAFIDELCFVTPTWLSRITAPLSLDPRVSVVFGTVRPAPFDPALGFLQTYACRAPAVARSVSELFRIEGVGACMAVRRSVWEALRGFDERLGADASLRSAEGLDFVIRALLAGFSVAETDTAVVIQSALHALADGPTVAHDELFGRGAVLAKHVKCAHWPIAAGAARLAVRWTLTRPLFGTSLHRRARIRGLLRGFGAGLVTPVDRRTGLFRRPDRPAAGPRPRHARSVVQPLEPVVADRAPARLEPPLVPATADRVSIVVPSWNAQPFLERALASLVARTTYPYELIVVDNGSTDGSKTFIRSFLRDHPEVDATVIDNPENRYFSTACNQGFRAASPTTKYLALYCNDVEATRDTWLQELVEAIRPEDTIAAGQAVEDTVTDRQREVFLSYDPAYPEAEVKRRVLALVTRPGATYTHVSGHCFLLKRALLHRTGLYLHTGPFTQYHSDWEWYLRFAAMGFRIAAVPIGVHHWHSVSELRVFHPDRYRDLLRRIQDPATLERDLARGRPLYPEESGFRSRYATPVARAVARVRRRVLGE